MADFIVDDTTTPEQDVPVGMGRGLIPRDYSVKPVGSYGAQPANIPLIPRSEIVERVQEMTASKSRTSDIRRRSGPGGGHIPALDQNGQGYCWNYSLMMVMMLARAIMNQPYIRLSGHANACLIKNYRDEGGWCGLALERAMIDGAPSVEFWKEKSMSRSNDTPAMRENAKLHIVTHAWVDLQASVYDRNFSEDQANTLLLSRVPLQGDFNHWSHSVSLMDVTIASESYPHLFQGVQVYSHLDLKTLMNTDFGSLDLDKSKDAEIYFAAFGKKGLNSWTDDYGDLGEFVLTGTKARLDGGVAALVTNASLV